MLSPCPYVLDVVFYGITVFSIYIGEEKRICFHPLSNWIIPHIFIYNMLVVGVRSGVFRRTLGNVHILRYFFRFCMKWFMSLPIHRVDELEVYGENIELDITSAHLRIRTIFITPPPHPPPNFHTTHSNISNVAKYLYVPLGLEHEHY